MTKSNGLEYCTVKTNGNPIEPFSLTSLEDLEKCVELKIKTDSLIVCYLDYTVLVGRYKNKTFEFFDNQSFDPVFIQKIRIFNVNQELLFWRSNGAFKGRYRKDGEGDEKAVVDSMQVLFGTKCEDLKNGYTRLSEKRGTEIILPFNGLKADDKKNRVFIKTRNYIDYNDAHQATYADCRFVGFYRWNKEASKMEEIGDGREK